MIVICREIVIKIMRNLLLYCLCQMIMLVAVSQRTRLYFDHPGLSAGLQEEHIWSIYQDTDGFIWLASFTSGLIRYDGNDFKLFQHDPQDSTSISDNWVTCLFEDSNGHFWVGTRNGGLNLFDQATGVFYHFQSNPNIPHSISHNLIRDIVEDDSGNMWVGTDSGLNRFEYSGNPTEKHRFDHFHHRERDSLSLSNNSITDLLIDSKGRFWVATYGGLNQLQSNGDFTRYTHNPQNDLSLSHNLVRKIREDREGHLWVGTFGNGLNLFDAESGEFKRFVASSGEKSIPSDLIWDIAIDSLDNLWIGTEDKGLIYFDRQKNSFETFMNEVANERSISSNQVFSAFISRENDLWVGTWGGGINFVHGNRKPFIVYSPAAQKGSISHKKVTSLFERDDGNILVGTEGGGLNLYDPIDEQFTPFKHIPGNNNTICSNEILTLFEDSKGFVWVGTRGAGISVLYPDLGSVYRHFNYSSTGLASHTIRDIAQDTNENIWTATDGGLNLLKPNSRTLETFLAGTYTTSIFPYNRDTLLLGTRSGAYFFNISAKQATPLNAITEDQGTLDGQWISRIFRDSRQNVWIGAHQLYLYEPRSHQLKTTHVGATGYAEDDSGHFWLASEHGLTKLNIHSGLTSHYNEADELPTSHLSQCIKMRNGELLVGGLNGLIRFDPDQIKTNHKVPKVVLSEFYLFNQPTKVKTSDSDKLVNISRAGDIILNHQQPVFSIGFSALQFAHSAECQYAYKLDGFDEDWITTDSERRIATYTNLDPGEYTFHVKATNNDGIWSQSITSIPIRVIPPPWKTWWAYTIYGVLALLVGFLLRKHEMQRLRDRHGLELNALETKRLKELDELKSRLFANISHEFRTPLTLILGPLHQAIKTLAPTDPNKEELAIAIKNARRLQELINQILDLSKLDQGKMTLQVIKDDIIAFLQPRVLAFSSLAERKGLTYQAEWPHSQLTMYFDPDKIEKIVNNLISNSIKFTSKGHITVRCSVAGKWFEIRVKDSGVGIPPEFLDQIFDRFFQVEGRQITSETGSGIGLSLTKELVELSHGTIACHSQEGVGTEFIVTLPCDDAWYQNNQHLEHPIPDTPESPLSEDDDKPSGHLSAERKDQKTTVLVVEDNEVLRKFIIRQLSQLSPDYFIQEASDGMMGFEKALQEIPDIVIMDWMMPGYSGIELCEKLKRDEITSHIPVIMLTAKADQESRIQGLEKGADAYLAKPFDQQELSVTIKNLLTQREKLREKFGRYLMKVDPVAGQSVDDKFIQKIRTLIEENLSDSTLNVQSLSHELGMSRSQLFRKIKAITGLSPNQFLRVYRLEKAHQLLSGKHGNVSEIAYRTGFDNLSYFTKSFFKHFNKLPSDLHQKKDS